MKKGRPRKDEVKDMTPKYAGKEVMADVGFITIPAKIVKAALVIDKMMYTITPINGTGETTVFDTSITFKRKKKKR